MLCKDCLGKMIDFEVYTFAEQRRGRCCPVCGRIVFKPHKERKKWPRKKKKSKMIGRK